VPAPYTIARLADAAGVHVETIRYYQRRRLVPEPPRPVGGIRRYDEHDAERLRFIKRAQAMGFTLSEMSSLLALKDRRSCSATRKLAQQKLDTLDARIRELRSLRRELAALVKECGTNRDDTCCPVIDRLAR
jgi:MerR family mercuric resistance operon transcriptional regulator